MLSSLAKPVDDVASVQDLIQNMYKTMYVAQGIGLGRAAGECPVAYRRH